MRKVNQVLTCSFSRGNPLQAMIVSIATFLAVLVLMTAVAAIIAV